MNETKLPLPTEVYKSPALSRSVLLDYALADSLVFPQLVNVPSQHLQYSSCDSQQLQLYSCFLEHQQLRLLPLVMASSAMSANVSAGTVAERFIINNTVAQAKMGTGSISANPVRGDV